jgi:hypothetical protein
MAVRLRFEASARYGTPQVMIPHCRRPHICHRCRAVLPDIARRRIAACFNCVAHYGPSSRTASRHCVRIPNIEGPSPEKLIDRMSETRALVPKYPMPIEPPAMHPRVAAQEGRFIIFGRTHDLLDQKIRLERRHDCTTEKVRLIQLRFKVQDVNEALRELAQLGVSKRTLFPDLAGLAEFVRWKHFHKIGGYNLESGGG